MVNISIDGRKIKAKEGSTILDAARELNIPIPTLCFHPDLSAFGGCRLCTVEVKTNGSWQLATSCTTPVEQGMEVRVNSEAAKEARKAAAALLYYKHPETEAVREAARKAGIETPLREGESHDCILCGLCVRACNEIVGVDALTFNDRGRNREIDEPSIQFNPNTCIGCGSCAFACPTGYVKMEQDGDRRIIWEKVFKMTPCNVCGRYFAPEDQLRYVSRTSGVPFSNLTTCTNCR